MEDSIAAEKGDFKSSSQKSFGWILFGIPFGPFDTPYTCRSLLQPLATFFILFWFYFGAWLTGIFVFYHLLCSQFAWIALIYLGWYVWDFDQPNRGGRASTFVRNLGIFQLLIDYFPVSLTKTVDLSPDNNYIFGYHPHGVFSVGTLGSFCTDRTGFREKYPGLTVHPLSSRLAYVFPIAREFFMSLGVSNSSKENIQYISGSSKGHAIVVIVGGAQESLDAFPGSTRLVLKDRKGFVRMALKTGCQLVPVYGFGENDLYHPFIPNPPGSIVRQVQRWFQRYAGIAPILVFGRGFFSSTYGCMPYKQPVNVIIGKPVQVIRNNNPSEDDVTELHQQYLKALVELFNTHKDANGYGGKELEFI